MSKTAARYFKRGSKTVAIHRLSWLERLMAAYDRFARWYCA